MKVKKYLIAAIIIILVLISAISYFSLSREKPGEAQVYYDNWDAVSTSFSARQTEWSDVVRETVKPYKIPILMYHEIKGPPSDISVPPENFAEQMKYLKDKGYHPITLDQYYEFRFNKKPLPVKPIIITLDDGYRDNYTNAYPILKKYGFKATIFIISGAVGRDNYLTWDMIKEMKNSGLIYYGGHTVTHPDLTSISPEQVEQEIVDSEKAIEKEVGYKLTFFAYPSGKENPKVIELTQKAGYLGAVIMGNGTSDNRIDLKTNMFTISRIFIGGKYNLETFAAKVNS